LVEISLNGQKILVTGATGRVGGAFATAFAKTNDVWGVARYSQSAQRDLSGRGSRERLAEYGITQRRADIASGDFGDLPDDFDVVLHAAANLHTNSLEDSLRDNVEGTALLMSHCRRAKVFLHVSTVAVYAQSDNPAHQYREDVDPIGGGALGYYSGAKAATEGAVRAMARTLGLPSVMCRLETPYGRYGDGGLPIMFLRQLIHHMPIRMSTSEPFYGTLLHEDDLITFVEPSLGIASVPAATINWGGDDVVRAEDYIDYMASLIGVEPVYRYEDGPTYPRGTTDPTFRQQVAGRCKIGWREGLRQAVADWEPLLRAAGPPASSGVGDDYQMARPT
jgi:nucleoside-diphosphate-sugar epimerase